MTDIAQLGLAIDSKPMVDAAAALDRMAASAGSAQGATDKLSNSTAGVASALDHFASRHNPLVNAQREVAEGERLVSAARASGLPVSQQVVTALDLARAKYQELHKHLGESSAAHGLNRMQMMESMHVARALADEIAATGNPFRALAMESGRISQIFASGSGGVTGTLKAFGGALLGLLNPVVLVGGGLVALGAAGLGAFVSFSNGQDKLARSLEGVGRAAGLTLAQLNGIAAAGAKAGNISIGGAQDLAATYAGSGALGGEQISGLIAITKRYSQVIGVDLAEAGNKLAAAFKDPAKGALDLNKELGFLDAATLRNIQDMQAQGNLTGAQTLLIEKQAAAVATIADRTWTWSKALEAVSGAASSAIQSSGRAIDHALNGPSDAERLQQLVAQQRTMAAQGIKPGEGTSLLGSLLGFKSTPGYGVPDNTAEIHELLRNSALRQGMARDDAAQQNGNRRSLEAQPIIYRNNDEAETLRKLTNDRDLLNKALKEGANLGPGATGALEKLNSQIANFTFASQRAAQDGALALQQVDAWSLSEHIAVDVARARTAAIRSGADAERVAIDSINARNLAIARANDTADKALRNATDSHALGGLTPYERALKEHEFKVRDLRETLTLDKGDKTGLPGMPTFTVALDQSSTHLDRLAIAAGGAATALGARAAGSDISFAHGSPYGALSQSRAGFSATGATGLDGLNIKSAESTAGGAVSAAVLTLAHVIQAAAVPGGFNRFTAFNDNYHEGTGSQHAKGLAGDFTINDPSQHAAAAAFVRELMRAAGTSGRVIDEYASPSARATGGHIHYQLDGQGGAAAAGGIPAAVKSTTPGTVNQFDALGLADIKRQFGADVIKAENDNLLQQNNLLGLNIAAFGRSTYEVARAAEAQKLLSGFQQAGVPITDALRTGIDKLADGYGNLAVAAEKAKAQQQNIINGLDSVRDASNSILGGLAHALAEHKKPIDALKASLAGIGSKLIDTGVNGITTALFGGQGKAGGGLFGDLLGGLFGGGKGGPSAVGVQNVSAGIVNVNGGLGGALGGGGGGGGGGFGIIGSIFSAIFGGGGATGGAGGIGHNAEGTDAWAGGPTWVGEKGPEIVNVPRGAQIVPNNVARGGSGAATTIHSRGGDVIIQGNADSNMIPQIKAYVDAKQAEQTAKLQRDLGNRSMANNRLYG